MNKLKFAQSVIDDRSNGSISGISTGKGGRAWIDGEFCLDELEALCYMIRHQDEVGFKPDGFEEAFERHVKETGTDDLVLEHFGWVMTCQSPLEIESIEDPQSCASGYAAQLLISQMRDELFNSGEDK